MSTVISPIRPTAVSVERVDPRAQWIALAGVVLFAALLPNRYALALAGVSAILTVLLVATGFPLRRLNQYLWHVLPLVLFLAAWLPAAHRQSIALWHPWGVFHTTQGWAEAVSLVFASLTILAATAWMLNTCSFSELLAGLHNLGLPPKPVLLLGLSLRYLDRIGRHAGASLDARALRDPGVASFRVCLRGWAGLLSALWLRTLEDADQLYEAMSARGFEGAGQPPIRTTGGWGGWVLIVIGLTLPVAALGLKIWGNTL